MRTAALVSKRLLAQRGGVLAMHRNVRGYTTCLPAMAGARRSPVAAVRALSPAWSPCAEVCFATRRRKDAAFGRGFRTELSGGAYS